MKTSLRLLGDEQRSGSIEWSANDLVEFRPVRTIDMTVTQYKAFKRFHKRSVRLSEWLRAQDYLSPLLAIVGAALLCVVLWN